MPKIESCSMFIVDDDYSAWQQNVPIIGVAKCGTNGLGTEWGKERTEKLKSDLKNDVKRVKFSNSKEAKCECKITRMSGSNVSGPVQIIGNGSFATSNNPDEIDAVKYMCRPSKSMRQECSTQKNKIDEQAKKQDAAQKAKAEKERKELEAKEEKERLAAEAAEKKKTDEANRKADAEAAKAADKNGGQMPMPPMPGAPELPPVLSEKFDALVAFGIGNMDHFEGISTTEKNAASKTQVTIVSQCTQEGLLFESNNIELKWQNGTPVDEDERKAVFMTANEDKGNWVIPARKINGCSPIYNGQDKFNYEILSLSNDSQSGSDIQFKAGGLAFRNNFEYLKGKMTNTMSHKTNMERFCADLKYCAETQRISIQAYRQNLLEMQNKILHTCNKAALGSLKDDALKTKQDSYINIQKGVIKQNTDLITQYNTYKVSVIEPGIKASQKRIEEIRKEIEQKTVLISDAEIIIARKTQEIASYKSNILTMDGYIVTGNDQVKGLEKQLDGYNNELKNKTKDNIAKSAENIKAAEEVQEKFNANAKKMYEAGRGIRGFATKSMEELKTVMTKCGKSELKETSFEKIETSLKDIFASVENKDVRKFRKAQGYEE